MRGPPSRRARVVPLLSSLLSWSGSAEVGEPPAALDIFLAARLPDCAPPPAVCGPCLLGGSVVNKCTSFGD